MILTVAVLLIALSGAMLLQVRSSKKLGSRIHFGKLIVGSVLLAGAGIVTWYGVLHPTVLMPNPRSP